MAKTDKRETREAPNPPERGGGRPLPPPHAREGASKGWDKVPSWPFGEGIHIMPGSVSHRGYMDEYPDEYGNRFGPGQD